MSQSLTRVKFGVVGVVSLLIIGVLMRAGLAEGGPWGPFEAAAVAITMVAILLFKSTEAHLSTRQEGVALALLILLCLGIVAVDALITGEAITRDLLGKIGIGLLVALAFVVWPSLSRRGTE
ncbi:1,4-dihydroxy-2-naphthoate octaprenyltransferase (plasmid) [Haloferax sp. S1W]|uniref:1,4-dihydroxy-2-naphthoate octaprenyltransferase n=1 Tax=Haloferax sp. S1W TaxID=3377110 RepID=UPI0037CC5687